MRERPVYRPSCGDDPSRARSAKRDSPRGNVIRNIAGRAKSDEHQLKNLSYKICRQAELPERGWHTLRHTFGTHAALFGVNPWRLMTWLGHKHIDETMRYVHVADSHRRELPREILAAAEGEFDPDRRITKLMGGRAELRQPDGNTPKRQEGHANRVAFQVLTGGVDGTRTRGLRRDRPAL